MTLSRRALSYLATLDRVEAVSVGVVVEALRRANVPAFDSWLDFHGRYAGYVEPIGRELAIYGLVHRSPYWLPPGEVEVERDGDDFLVMCAEVHPSYDYWLGSDGEFTGVGGGGPCQSFDIMVEQDALIQEVERKGWALRRDVEQWSEDRIEELTERMRPQVVEEATDKYRKCYAGPDALLFVSEGALSLWTRDAFSFRRT